jgi:hypothetical protein
MSAQDDCLLRLKQRLIALPPGVGIVEFIRHDGRTPVPAAGNGIVAKSLTLAGFRDRRLDTHRECLESSTIEGIDRHFRHLAAARPGSGAWRPPCWKPTRTRPKAPE